MIGVSGAQGTGKSTLADYLRKALGTQYAQYTAVLSLDDYYLTKSERRTLATSVHPLLLTRGVPGSHDVGLLCESLNSLRQLQSGQTTKLPRFDKSVDDRVPEEHWTVIEGPVDLIILEGWCVASVPQPHESLLNSLNELEAREDPSGLWRRYVNEKLMAYEASIFCSLDATVFLEAPSFEAIFEWRQLQERKLEKKVGRGAGGIMDSQQLRWFMQHYERITRHNLDLLPATADVVLTLNEDHECIESRYRCAL